MDRTRYTYREGRRMLILRIERGLWIGVGDSILRGLVNQRMINGFLCFFGMTRRLPPPCKNTSFLLFVDGLASRSSPIMVYNVNNIWL